MHQYINFYNINIITFNADFSKTSIGSVFEQKFTTFSETDKINFNNKPTFSQTVQDNKCCCNKGWVIKVTAFINKWQDNFVKLHTLCNSDSTVYARVRKFVLFFNNTKPLLARTDDFTACTISYYRYSKSVVFVCVEYNVTPFICTTWIYCILNYSMLLW